MVTGIQGTEAGAGAVAARGSSLRRISARAADARAATLLLAAAAAASAALLLLYGSRLTFLLDDWEFLIYRRGFNADAILLPHGENIAIGPVLVYKALLATVGMDSALPFRVVSTAAFIASVALLFVYLRRRVGPWAALAGAAMILFLGAAWEDLLWPFQIGYFVSMGAGLGMLLALERGDRNGDRLACALLALSLLFSSLGIPFAAGAAVAILLGGRETWRRRAYVVVVPLALFALWWLGWGREADTSITLGNIVTAPLFLIDGVASSLSSLLGLATPRDEAGIGALDWGRLLLVIAVAVAAWRLWRLGRVPTWLLVAATIAAVFWLLAGINEKSGREPTASRYQYVGAVFLLLIAAELARGVRLRRGAIAALFAVTALAVMSNLAFLDQAYTSYKGTSDTERADLAALEIARGRVKPDFILDKDIARTEYVHIEAGPYFSAADAFGSPAFSEDELAAAPEPAREAADLVLANALPVSFTTGVSEPEFGGPAPSVADAAGPSLAERSCLVVGPPEGGGSRLVELPPGGAVIEAPPRSPAAIKLRRFATTASSVIAGEVPPGQRAVLEIPTDRSARPWVLELEARGLASVCGREPA